MEHWIMPFTIHSVDIKSRLGVEKVALHVRSVTLADKLLTKTGEGGIMLHWSLIFLVIAIIAALFGFGGIAGAAAGIAKILFVVFLVVWLVALVIGRRAL
jgi:uncharacterized membrane protein YtjA (UPF0391 family)